ncbi:MAG: hypothetical protein EBZ77_18090, partial [Chitinophagia bacterium]|nr:hypothetical protein [Chitinophagia bacterium]
TINTIAGNGTASTSGDGGPAVSASLYNPGGVYYEPATGDIFLSEYTGSKIRKINSSGTISTYAGVGYGYSGDGGPASAARFTNLIDVLGDGRGNLYVVDNSNQRIRKINSSGIVSTFAGTGRAGYSGDGGPATAAQIRDPNRLGIDPFGNVYIADANNNVIRKVDTNGIITTVAGNTTGSFAGDGGQATAASLHTPLGVGFDIAGNMYIADAGNNRIRKVAPNGIISTFAGYGTAGYTGDGGAATAAAIDYPNGITVDRNCNVYFADWNRNVVRKITYNGYISTVVGTNVAGFAGDGGPATAARLNGPNNLCFDPYMNLYIPEYYDNRIRQVVQLGDTR